MSDEPWRRVAAKWTEPELRPAHNSLPIFAVLILYVIYINVILIIYTNIDDILSVVTFWLKKLWTLSSCTFRR